MKRFAVPFMIVGSVAVLIALVALLRSITAGPATTPPPARTATETPTAASPRPEAPAAARHSGSSSSSGGGTLAQILRHTRSADSESGSTSPADDRTPEERGDGPPATRYNTKNLQYGLPQIRDKIAGNTPQIVACVGGNRPTGNATMTFIVAQRAGKIVIEQSDYDRDASTLQDESLLECFAKAANMMQFEGLPREADAIIVTRSIALENGVVTSDKLAKFSYIR